MMPAAKAWRALNWTYGNTRRPPEAMPVDEAMDDEDGEEDEAADDGQQEAQVEGQDDEEEP